MRRGFTIVELLIVMSIIAILVALLIPALGMLRNGAKKADTQTRVSALTHAIETMLAEDPLLGDYATTTASGGDFPTRYIYYCTQKRVDRDPPARVLLDYPLKNYRQTGGALATSADNAAVLIDGFGNPILVEVDNLGRSGRMTHTSRVRVQSTLGTLKDPTDDIVMELTVEDERWVKLRYDPATKEFVQ